MTLAAALTVAAGSFFLALALTEWARRLALRFHVLDVENARSSHTGTVPSGGGIGVVIGVSLVALTSSKFIGHSLSHEFVRLHALGTLLAVVGLVDDVRRRVDFRVKLGAQALCAILLVSWAGAPDTLVIPGLDSPVSLSLPPRLAVVVTVTALVGFTNAFNFMDGIDGLAGAEALIGSLVMAWLGWRTGSPLAAGALAVGSSAAGFLVLNRPPAKIFMGDAGSQYLGFMLAGLALLLDRTSGVPATGVGLVFLPFAIDPAITLAARIRRGAKWWEPHREHVYQQLVEAGWSHGRTTILYGGLASACGLGAVLFYGERLLSGWVVWILVLPTILLPILPRRGKAELHLS